MKNTNTVSQLALMILLIISLSSGACKKQLNVYPTTSVVDGDVITDLQSAQTVLNGVYYTFADVGYDDYSGVTSTLWTDVNEDYPSEYAGLISYPYEGSLLDSTDLSPDDGFVELKWRYGYALVNAASGLIKNLVPVNSISAATKQQMLAEARFLRAFGNSDLLLYFGQYNDPSSKYGIILRDTFVTAANINTPRSGVAAAYTSILSDLDAAIKGLAELNTAIYYANASVAKLLEARVLINRGAPGDYAQVISLTNDIITNGPFALEDSLKDIFLTKGFSSKEVMLGVQPYPDESYKFFNYQQYYYAATDSLISLLADDARKRWVYKTVSDPYYPDQNFLMKYNSGDPLSSVQPPLSVYSYAFRLSEAYLLEAEAITLSDGDLSTAKTLLATVMSHAGAGVQEMAAVANAATPEDLQLEIVKENMRNFTYENGVDMFAMRRLPFATLQKLNPNFHDQHQLIWPIPTSEIDYNSVFQNPGY